MTDNKQQSVVSWFLKELIKDGYIKRIPVLQFQKAKAMHKQEIIDAANKLLYHNTGLGDTAAEQYYNETYGNDKQ
jgi:hypothetical protein